MVRDRYVDIYVPVGPGAGTGNPLKPIFLAFGAVIGLGVLVMILVVTAFPSPEYPTGPVPVSSVPSPAPIVCAPVCPAPRGGEPR